MRCLVLSLLLLALPFAVAEESAFVSFERIQVAPVSRSDTARWVDAGTIETDGYKELVFSLGGEFKESVPNSGRVGAILVPDNDVFDYLLRNEGEVAFPLEAKVQISQLKNAIFISDQQVARIAFPRYRVFLYNETSSGAVVSLFVYRTR